MYESFVMVHLTQDDETIVGKIIKQVPEVMTSTQALIWALRNVAVGFHPGPPEPPAPSEAKEAPPSPPIITIQPGTGYVTIPPGSGDYAPIPDRINIFPGPALASNIVGIQVEELGGMAIGHNFIIDAEDLIRLGYEQGRVHEIVADKIGAHAELKNVSVRLDMFTPSGNLKA